MTDLVGRIAHEGEFDDPPRPSIALHRWKSAQDLYAFGLVTRQQIATEFDLQGDEARQAGQLADNIDAERSFIGITFNGTNITWTNQPLALTELFGNPHRRLVVDLTRFDRVAISGRISTIGATGSAIYAEYSIDGGTVWNTLTTNQLAMGTIGTRATAWETIPAQAKQVAQVRFVGVGGNGAADPVIGLLELGLDAPYNRAEYLTKIEAILICVQKHDDHLYHNGDGTLNRTKIFADLGIAG